MYAKKFCLDILPLLSFVFIWNTLEGSMNTDVSKTLIRMPQYLKDALRGKAKEECRSFNSEVIKRLMESLKEGEAKCS